MSGSGVARALPGAALFAGFVALFSCTFGMTSTWPPEFNPAWIVTNVIAAFAVALGLAGARLAESIRPRLILTAGIALALWACWIALNCYRETYHDYPLGALVAWAIALPVGCWFCRLRIPAVAFVALMGCRFGWALLPPLPGQVRTVTHGDLTMSLTVDSGSIGGCELSVQGPSGEDLNRRYDLDNIRPEASIGPLIPVSCWPPNRGADFLEGPAPAQDRATLRWSAFIPNRTKNWDARLFVTKWSAHPQAFAVVDVDEKSRQFGKTIVHGADGGYALRVSAVKRGPSTNTLPVVQCLHLDIGYSGPDVHGSSSSDLRFTDDSGKALQSSDGDWDGDHGDYELFNLDPGIKRVRIDFCSQTERAKNEVVFAFPRLRVGK